MQTFGHCDPPLIDQNNNLIDGDVRVQAHRLLGLETIQCVVVHHMDAKALRYLRIALNRLQEKGNWDIDGLKLEFGELLEDDLDITMTGFDLDEVDQILQEDVPSGFEYVPATPAATRVQPGDLYELDGHRVLCADARDPDALTELIGDQPVRLVLTDQPFNVRIQGHVTGGNHPEFAMASGELSPENFQKFTDAWMAATHTHLVDGGVLCTFIDWRHYDVVNHAANKLGLTALNLVVWAKTNAGMGTLYRSQHELLPIFKKGHVQHVNNVNLGRKGRWRSNLWTCPGASAIGSDARRGLEDHPTVKPVALLEDAILDLSNRDEIVLDPFLGSGSTLIAAEKSGRRCFGIEIEPKYVQVVLERFERATGSKPVLSNRNAIPGEPFP